MQQDYLDLAREVLDRQIIDANQVPCGKVDDIEVKGGAGELKITSILVGGEARSERAPGLVRWLVRILLGTKMVRVPWSEVSIITHHVKLKSTAHELGLDRAERRASSLVQKIPGAGL